jgi:peptide/nickel transport system permease protein
LFLLGSDAVGRDVLSRAIIGTRTSLAIGIVAAFGALLLGTIAGLGASLGTTVVNRAVTWTTDVFLSIPSIFLVVALAFFVGGSLWGLIAVLVLSGWMRTARIVRGEMLHLREQEFIQAARLLGVSRIRLVQRHFLPNLVPVLATSTVLLISEMLLAEAALGFLGFGVQPPLPSWGNMLGEAITHLERSWWIAAAPGTCLTIFVLALHHTAERSEAGTRF